jgi:pimeloyl-ACP methyl ester carboxylesterase
MSYQKKYNIYKNKYLKLKNSIQKGGSEKIVNKLITNDKDIGELIRWIDSQNYYDNNIGENLGWTIHNLEPLDFELETVKATINFNWCHLHNPRMDLNRRPLIVLPGFSSDSLGMTLKRLNMYRFEIFNKFSDIYVFDFTGLGKRKDNPENQGVEIQSVIFKTLGKEKINTMYEIVSGHLTNLLRRFDNISVLGRSAGGGLALELVFTHNLNVIGLNVACLGTNLEIMRGKIARYPNKDLPIRLTWAFEDEKAPERDGREIAEVFMRNGFKNFVYLLVTTGGDSDEKKTHRIQPILISNLQ